MFANIYIFLQTFIFFINYRTLTINTNKYKKHKIGELHFIVSQCLCELRRWTGDRGQEIRKTKTQNPRSLFV